MTQHTPGPWQVNKKLKFSVEAVADGQGINLIAECCDPDGIRSVGEDSANARLIAAAPDLLAALELFRKSGIGNSTDFEIQAKAFEAMSAALLKAKGESHGR